jgi:hypothetical protein
MTDWDCVRARRADDAAASRAPLVAEEKADDAVVADLL